MRHTEVGLTGIILAGGQSRRMGGSPKALLNIDSEKMIERQLRILCECCDECIVVVNEPGLARFSSVPRQVPHPYLATDGLDQPVLSALLSYLSHISVDTRMKIVTDEYPGMGPLSGMHAGMTAASNEWVWVIGCDMPFISAAAALLMLQHLIDEGDDAVIPYIDGQLHPLHGVYRRSCGESIPKLLEQQRLSVKRYLEELDMIVWPEEKFRVKGIDASFVMNVNTPDDYASLLALVK